MRTYVRTCVRACVCVCEKEIEISWDVTVLLHLHSDVFRGRGCVVTLEKKPNSSCFLLLAAPLQTDLLCDKSGILLLKMSRCCCIFQAAEAGESDGPGGSG